MDVAIDLIKPSPYQPRLYFDIEELKASINNDGMLVAALVREKPDEKTRYEIMDGERRWRAAKELNWRQIPIEIRNVDDETARRMVYTLNEERQPYTVEENTKFFRRMYDQMGSVYAVAQAFKRPQSTIWNYINVSILPEHFQKSVWNGHIPMGSVREMEPIFTQARDEIGDITSTLKYENSPSYQKILVLCEGIYSRQIAGTAELKEQYVDPYLETLDKARIAKAKEEVERIVPSHLIEATVKMETPEDLERAAGALRREALRQREEAMTPEEKAALEAERKAKLEAQAIARAQREEERKQREVERRRQLEEMAMRKARRELKKDVAFVKEAVESLPSEAQDVVMGISVEEREKLEQGRPPRTPMDAIYELDDLAENLYHKLGGLEVIPSAGIAILGTTLRSLQGRIREVLHKMGLTAIEGESRLIDRG